MHKYYIVSIFGILFNLSAASAITRDSIGVENNKGKKLIVHQVVAKDTYYSIGRRYNVAPKEIMAFNDSKYLQIGVIVKVPTNIPFTTAATAPAQREIPVSGNSDGNLTEHVVQRKENLNMLAERYGTTVNEIKRVNNLNTINLQIGQILKIPSKEAVQQVESTPLPTKVAEPVAKTVPPVVEKPKRTEPVIVKKDVPQQVPASNEEFVEHTVASNETIYSIATTYKMTMDQLKAKNNMTDNSLRVGQKLLIKGQYPAKKVFTPSPDPQIHPDTLNSIKDPALRYPASKYGLNQIDEKGTAVWIEDPNLESAKMYVLHRSAPVGTVMKITNPMTNRSTFAKVVGKFTENESTKDVIIVMSKAVADALGALDKRFFCNLTYGGQDNE
jgi:peptidoglycan endopeptidase LytF